MNIKSNKGSITIFVLVGLLFMTGFLLISFGSNVNKSKVSKEQFNIMSSIYSHNDGDENAYDRAYTAIRKKNAKILTKFSENSSTIELTKTFEDTLNAYKIYGNSIQNGTPTPNTPVEIQSVGDKTKNLFKPLVKGVGLNFSTGIENKHSAYSCSDYIQVDFNTNPNYCLSGLLNTLYSCVFAYNSNKEFLGRTSGSGRSYISLTKNSFKSGTAQGEGDIAYLRIMQYVNANLTGTIDDIDNANIQLEIGTQATEYEPYGKYKIPVKISNGTEEITTNIYLDEPLRKIGNYADYIDFEKKQVVRNIFEYVFTGKETWGSPINELTNTIRSYINNIVPRVVNSFIGYSEKGVFDGKSTYSYDEERCQFSNSTNKSAFYVRILKTRCADANSPQSSDFQNIYNEGTKIYGVLETPDPQPIELPKISTYEDYTKIEVLTEIEPSKIEVEYLGYTIE